MPPSWITNPRSGCTGPPASTGWASSPGLPPSTSICPSTSPMVYSEGRLPTLPMAPSSSCWQFSATLRAKPLPASDGRAISNWLAKFETGVSMAAF